MARFPSTGINVPGFLNTCNSPSQSGYQDAIGNPYWMGTTAGKIVTLGPNEVSQFTAPGTSLYDGAYQWVRLDSGATAANAVAGNAAFFLLDQGGPAQGTLPETAYRVPTVTTADIANTLGLYNFFAGVFLNPATFNGQSNTPTPGNWCFIFVGAGRAAVNYGSVAGATLGQPVYPDSGHVGKFQGNATPPTTGTPWGVAATTQAVSTTGVVYFSELLYRIPF